jgi:hypothetical protein
LTQRRSIQQALQLDSFIRVHNGSLLARELSATRCTELNPEALALRLRPPQVHRRSDGAHQRWQESKGGASPRTADGGPALLGSSSSPAEEQGGRFPLNRHRWSVSPVELLIRRGRARGSLLLAPARVGRTCDGAPHPLRESKGVASPWGPPGLDPARQWLAGHGTRRRAEGAPGQDPRPGALCRLRHRPSVQQALPADSGSR